MRNTRLLIAAQSLVLCLSPSLQLHVGRPKLRCQGAARTLVLKGEQGQKARLNNSLNGKVPG
jgi:hypothetical protein